MVPRNREESRGGGPRGREEPGVPRRPRATESTLRHPAGGRTTEQPAGSAAAPAPPGAATDHRPDQDLRPAASRLDAILAEIVDRAVTLFAADAAGLWRFEAEADRPFRLAAERGVSPDLLRVVADLRREEPAPGLRALAEDRVVVIDRAGAYNERLRAVYERNGFETICFVPVVLDGAPLGLLVLYHRSDHIWTEAARALARGFAEHVAMAIQNGRLYGSLQDLAARLRAIQDLGLRLDRIRDVTGIGEAIVDEVGILLDVDTVRVYEIDEKRQTCEPIAFRGRFLGLDDPGPDALRVEVGRGLTGWVAAHGEPLRLGDAAADPRSLVVGRPEGPESMLLVPMRSEDRVVGLIVVSKEGRDRFTPDDEQLLTIFAAHAAQAIVNARHHARLQEQQAALERQLASQQRLLEVTERLVAARDPAEVLEEVADALAELVHYDTLAVYRLDPAAGVRRAVVARDHYAEVVLGHAAPIGSGLTGWAIAHRQPVLANDAHLDPRATQIPGTPFEPESMIVVPLMAGGQVVGTLNVGRVGGPEAHFSAAEFELVQLFAAQAANALQNAEAHLAAQVRARLDSLTGLDNHGAFQADLARAIEAGSSSTFALVMLDLDGFKAYNDARGHPAGDLLLQQIAGAIRGAIRAGDRAYRYGGDEFAVLLPGADRRQGRRIEARIRTAISALTRSDGPPVEASTGLAVFPIDGVRADELVAVADEALYLAKAARPSHARDPRDAYLATLTETAAVLMTQVELSTLEATVVQRAAELLGVEDALLYLVDEARDRLVPVAGRGRLVGRRRGPARGEGLAGRAWLTGSVLDSDRSSTPRGRRQRRGTGAEVAIPLVVRGRTVGVLVLRTGAGRRLSARERGALARFADLAAVALDNARGAADPRRTPEQHPSARQPRSDGDLPSPEERFRRLADATGEALVIHREGRILQVNRAFEALFGCPPGGAVGRSVLDFAAPESLPALTDHWQRHPDDAIEVLARTEDGRLFPVRVVGRPIPWEDGEARLASIRDLREQRGLEARLAREARHDRVTGLLNRRALTEELAAALGLGPAPPADPAAGPGPALILLDLDRFTTINETLGHAAGDDALAAIAGRLGELCRPSDVVARVGSDEFGILLTGPADPETAIRVGHRILAALREPLRIAGHEVFVGASVGVAWAGSEATPEGLLRDAEIALHRAKEAGGDRLVVFEPTLRLGRHERLDLEADLRRAIERSQLRLHYQPIVDLRSEVVVGLEALLRWEHPERGLVPPLTFVPLAEETGLIADIGRWVLGEATRQAAAWRGAGRAEADGPFVGINLSAREFGDPGLVDAVRSALEATDLDPDRLELEITESVLMDEGGPGIAVLRALKELGVRLVLDDFGTGYASLGYLSRLPLDAIKLDRSFVARLPQDQATLAIVRAVVGLAHDLGMAVVAEGIERPDQRTALAEIGCDRGQGYLWSVPVPAERISPSWRQVAAGRNPRPGETARRPRSGSRSGSLSRGSSRRAGAA